MTNAARWAFRGPLVPSVLAAFLIGVVTWFAAMAQPEQYEARVDLLASPGESVDAPSLTQFASVAGQSLAAIIDVAQSPSALAKAGSVPGDVVVDVIPASLLTRISVRASTSEAARQAVLSIASEVIAKNLLSPVGKLRLVDDQPFVAQVVPDAYLAAGLALAAGVAIALAVFVLYALIRPSRTQRVKRALAIAGISRPIAIVDCREAGAVAEIDALSRASSRPVRVVALSPASESDAAAFSSVLTGAGVEVTDNPSGHGLAVVGVVADTSVVRLSWAIAALPEDAQLIAVALCGSTGRWRKADRPER